MEPAAELTMEHLTKKLTMLLALLSGHRTQTLTKLKTDCMVLTSEKCSFVIPDLLKHTKPGSHQKPIVISAYPTDKRLCIVSVLRIYLEKTKSVRGNETQLLLSYRKPYKRVSRDTVSRWLKWVMNNAGIDTGKFSSHSTRAASVSAANQVGIPMDTILSAAGWSNSSTFDRFYNKNLAEQGTFANAVLEAELNHLVQKFMLTINCLFFYNLSLFFKKNQKKTKKKNLESKTPSLNSHVITL